MSQKLGVAQPVCAFTVLHFHVSFMKIIEQLPCARHWGAGFYGRSKDMCDASPMGGPGVCSPAPAPWDPPERPEPMHLSSLGSALLPSFSAGSTHTVRAP